MKDLEALCRAVSTPETVVVIDGYHGFLALPTDLGAIEDRAFYLAGGCKYAMSGEGACFLHVPAGCQLRPLNTGWFAQFGALSESRRDRVAYSDDGYRFFGATFDPTGLYRFNAVMRLLDKLDVSVADVHDHAIALQDAFLGELEGLGHAVVNGASLLSERHQTMRGHFLAFRHERALESHEHLKRQGVLTDARGDCLRFSFAPYHDIDDVRALLSQLAAQ